MALIEKLFFQKFFRIIDRGRIAGAHAPEEFQQCLFGNRLAARQIPFRFLMEGSGNKHAIRISINITEQRDQFLIRAVL